MRFASAISEDPRLERAVREAAARVTGELAGLTPDLLFAFTSPHHAAAYPDVPGVLAQLFPEAVVVGCSADGVIGATHEVEGRPAFSLTAACLPGVSITPFHVPAGGEPTAGSPRDAWDRALGRMTGAPTSQATAQSEPRGGEGPAGEPGSLHPAPPEPRAGPDPEDDPRALILFLDPFTSNTELLLRGLDSAYPRAVKLGGLASGGRRPRQSALLLGGRLHQEGTVGVALHGDVTIDTVIAQGCRPIGEPMLITRCRDSSILELGGRRPVDVIRDLHATLGERDRQLFQHSLFLGIEMKDQREYHAGDFLIRNIMGIDPKSGAISVDAIPRQWQVAQLHLRDAQTSAEDLVRLLERTRANTETRAPAGALLFSCLGRGHHLYGRPDHDTGLFAERFASTPVGGFFCNGEIGPVGETTFLHGYTSAFGLFRPKAP